MKTLVSRQAHYPALKELRLFVTPLRYSAGVNPVLREQLSSSPGMAQAYLAGASRDATFNRMHGTWRFAQVSRAWLDVIRVLLKGLNAHGWTYREGRTRSVYVLETTYQVEPRPRLGGTEQLSAFARGYFDAEGGMQRSSGDRFYIQLAQKDRLDLEHLRGILQSLALRCGSIHNPSAGVDPHYWRFYVATSSHADFACLIGSWHPRKRAILKARYGRTVTLREP